MPSAGDVWATPAVLAAPCCPCCQGQRLPPTLPQCALVSTGNAAAGSLGTAPVNVTLAGEE